MRCAKLTALALGGLCALWASNASAAETFEFHDGDGNVVDNVSLENILSILGYEVDEASGEVTARITKPPVVKDGSSDDDVLPGVVVAPSTKPEATAAASTTEGSGSGSRGANHESITVGSPEGTSPAPEPTPAPTLISPQEQCTAEELAEVEAFRKANY
ncbi:hypothetical protein Poli38472_013397 [Pythium oligandrum]|uniref:Uncharacterized protein n=1 Tax=Pythium oligandrum TaxID=41045 RepID=A0A8K1C811_PYTOL|nr:hypothetical protein Poli38472_013397 [Pythium oligandrum]|eukprot:TMW57923.1 hypothetical protein Poli38472_013397 [Pythium oligandrum]